MNMIKTVESKLREYFNCDLITLVINEPDNRIMCYVAGKYANICYSGFLLDELKRNHPTIKFDIEIYNKIKYELNYSPLLKKAILKEKITAIENI
jgi:hypothetical protein